MSRFQQLVEGSLYLEPKLSHIDSMAKLHDASTPSRTIDNIAHHHGDKTEKDSSHTPAPGSRAYASNSMPHEMAHAIVNHPNASTSAKYAAAGSGHADVLDKLASSHPHRVAANDKASSAHLEMAHSAASGGGVDGYHHTSRLIIHHPNTTTELLNKIARNPKASPLDLREIARHPKATAETLHHVATNPVLHHSAGSNSRNVSDTIKEVLKNPNTHPQTLRHIYNNHSPHREEAMAHPNGEGLRNFGMPT